MGLSETYSKNYKIIRDYVKCHVSTPVNTDVDSAIVDQSYNPDYIVKSIKQQQKVLTELETRTICERYKNGASSYELAKEFGCHRRTICDALKRNGVEVSHQAAKKPELTKRIIELYAEYKTPKEIGAIIGIGAVPSARSSRRTESMSARSSRRTESMSARVGSIPKTNSLT